MFHVLLYNYNKLKLAESEDGNMASGPEFVQYVADQLSGAGEITYRKMFGEYGMYLDGKIFALICEDQLFVKITEAGKKIAPELEEVPPYDGAKPYFLIEEIDDSEWLVKFVTETWKELPMPKPKKKRTKTAEKSASEKRNKDGV